jgi:hypothetical protein
MDYDVRIGKMEAQLAMNQKDIDRLHDVIIELRHSMQERFNHTDLQFGELRSLIDNRFREERKYNDQRFSEMQKQIDELRRELHLNIRWMIGLWLSTMGMMAGIGGRVFGMY